MHRAPRNSWKYRICSVRCGTDPGGGGREGSLCDAAEESGAAGERVVFFGATNIDLTAYRKIKKDAKEVSFFIYASNEPKSMPA